MVTFGSCDWFWMEILIFVLFRSWIISSQEEVMRALVVAIVIGSICACGTRAQKPQPVAVLPTPSAYAPVLNTSPFAPAFTRIRFLKPSSSCNCSLPGSGAASKTAGKSP